MKGSVLHLCYLFIFLAACQPVHRIAVPERRSSLSGSAFYRQVAPWPAARADSLARQELLAGNLPSFLGRFQRIWLAVTDSSTGRRYRAAVFVAPDYLAVGTDADWARIPLQPGTAQQVADRLDCFLPTRALVDAIYRAAAVRLEPVPLFAYRDSTPTWWHHHLILEGQRRGRRGLVAGHKKDVVISGAVLRDQRPNRVAIYGWHRTDGRPIQPLYTGHVNTYVDYSHGIRLVYRRLRVDGRWMDYTELLRHPVLRRLLCDEADCGMERYN
ncbi:MAG TPA: hypothetical protein PKE63_01280 [Lacibacter sp.]|nr:hypothetical protein [Lacibacter sp.]HMO88836.1 hypothetical protein [Lacibacter sp.]HMP85874.1 hypothetical protein [Lacibacter sp.]